MSLATLAPAVDAAPIVVGTTREQFRAYLAAPPPWDVAHVTAVAWVLDEAAGSILLVEHRLHGWSCAGGHVDPGERPADAAARELREETSIVAIPTGEPLVIGSSRGCTRSPGATHWTFGYRFEVDAGTPVQAEPGQAARWFRADDLPSPRPTDIDVVIGHLGWLP